MNSTKQNDKDKFIVSLRNFAIIGGDNLYDPIYERLGYRAARANVLYDSSIRTR
jgi:hypothetical protein